MILTTTLTEEDKKEVGLLAREIWSKAHSVNCRRLNNSLKGEFIGRFVGVPVNALKKRHLNERYSFFTENEVSMALYFFLTNIYNAKHVAKNIYIRDEDDVFTEQFDVEVPLGKIVLPNGSVITSSVVEAEIKVTNQEKRSNHHGMPFDIIKFRLVNPMA